MKLYRLNNKKYNFDNNAMQAYIELFKDLTDINRIKRKTDDLSQCKSDKLYQLLQSQKRKEINIAIENIYHVIDNIKKKNLKVK